MNIHHPPVPSSINTMAAAAATVIDTPAVPAAAPAIVPIAPAPVGAHHFIPKLLLGNVGCNNCDHNASA